MPWLLQAVRTFDNFTPDNDPYGEHDLGSVDWHNEKTYWKIDYYDQASFQEKRNALDVLGVRVVVQEPVETYGIPSDVDNISSGQEWFSAKEAARLLGVNAKTIHFYRKNGTITNYKYEPFLLVYRDELLKLRNKGFLQRNTEEIVRARVEISYSPDLISEEITSQVFLYPCILAST